MKILVIQTDSIGRIVQSTPLFRAIKKRFQIAPDILLKEENEIIAKENRNIENAISPKNVDSKFGTYDIVVDLVNNKTTRTWAKKLGKKVLSVKSNGWKEWVFINLKINQLPSKHRIAQQFEQLESLGLSWDDEGLDYFIPEKDYVENSWLPITHQNGYAVFAIGALTKTQQLPVERMIELCDRINKPIILLGEKEDISAAERIEEFFQKGTAKEEKEIEELNKKASIFNGCGKFNINQQASIIKESSWVFTHENDLMHIAAAFNKQIFSIWGSSSPFFGEYPFETKFTIFENNKISCRPCSRTGFEKCPKGHFKCMKELTFDFYLPD